MNKEPYVLKETDDYAVVFKPPKMHCVPLKKKDDRLCGGTTLLEWYAEKYPPVFDIMHRLDFETHGLVLFAKNAKSFEYFRSLQERGEFVKEYCAVCESSSLAAAGFPPPSDFSDSELSLKNPLVIESWFRPYGPGRKLVRPVIEDGKKHREIAKDRGGFYRTEIIGRDGNVFTARIKRGFRHQIRCHLCWIGFPILNDPLYGGQRPESGEHGVLALCAHALFFNDPLSTERREFRITPFNAKEDRAFSATSE